MFFSVMSSARNIFKTALSGNRMYNVGRSHATFKLLQQKCELFTNLCKNSMLDLLTVFFVLYFKLFT